MKRLVLILAVGALAACLGGSGGGGGGYYPPDPPDGSSVDTPRACTPSCAGRACGGDGCGGTCGVCVAPRACNAFAGVCEGGGCNSQCSGHQCGDDGCGGVCGTCPVGSVCDASGQCQCTPRCEGRTCGSNGCGGSCGACPAGLACDAVTGSCVAPHDTCNDHTTCGGCVPSSGCGWCASSGRCTSGSASGSTTEPCGTWRWGSCAGPCVPACDGRNCGLDGCGGTCGSCSDAEACNLSSGRCERLVFDLVAVSGTVNAVTPAGLAWDIAGGLPDPKVCVTIGSTRQCSRVASDTLRPAWNQRLFTGITPAILRGGYRVEYLDEDTTSDDTICAGVTTIEPTRYGDGVTFTVGCGDAASGVTFRLDAVR